MKKWLLLTPILMAALTLAACSSATGTPIAAEINTKVALSVAETVSAMAPSPTPSPSYTSTATSSPTETSTGTPTITPLPPAATPTPYYIYVTATQSGANGCYNATLTKSGSVPDGATLAPGQDFSKTWKFTNTGTCDLPANTYIVFVSGYKMGGSNTRIGEVVRIGKKFSATIILTAPNDPGTYTGYWQLADHNGNTFGPRVHVTIEVSDTITNTPKPTVTPTIKPTKPKTLTPHPAGP